MPCCPVLLPAIRIALLTEGVDRNSAPLCGLTVYGVALLTEGVDRNKNCSIILELPGTFSPMR